MRKTLPLILKVWSKTIEEYEKRAEERKEKRTINKKIYTWILLIAISIPEIINMYKTVYENNIKKQNEIYEKCIGMLEADKHIKTTYTTGTTKEKTTYVKEWIKRKRLEMGVK